MLCPNGFLKGATIYKLYTVNGLTGRRLYQMLRNLDVLYFEMYYM
jgi:hypothetical protein